MANRSQPIYLPGDVARQNPHFAVEALLRRRNGPDGAGTEYLVQLHGQPVSEASWLPRSNLARAHWLTDEFDRRNPQGAVRQVALRHDDPDIQHAVERILDERWDPLQLRREFLIKWAHWPSSESSWEPLGNLKNCPELLLSFERTRAAGLQVIAAADMAAEAGEEQADGVPGSSRN